MDILQEISKQNFRTGDKVEVTIKNVSKNEKDKEGKNKYRLTRFRGTVIGQKNPQQISYTFSVLKDSKGSDKVAIVSTFSYHSPLIVSIKVIGRINQEVHQAKLNYLERELAAKKDNE